MNAIVTLANTAQDILDKVRNSADLIGSLLLRAYLVPVFWLAANNKWNPFDKDSSLDPIIEWFGNAEWGLGLPLPALNAYMAWGAEYFGAILLALGLGTRWISVPLMVTMLVAMATVHWQNGWQAVHDLKSPFASEHAGDALDRLSRAKDILEEHGNIDWLTEHGSFLVSNNGIEWAATYFVMLLALFFLGGGKFVSLDYWIEKKFRKN
ncbi:MAG: DoxX family protein [Gammaproteobacteria bacterium]|jgi:putative oxidoreductase|nr:DoxX family protein [Gammaproteobacteria bacterium]